MLKIDAKLVKLREKLEAEPDAHKRAAISNQIETLRTANAILDGRSSDDDEARKSKARKVKAKSKGKRADEEEDSADEDDAEDEDEEDEKVKGKRTRALLRMTQAALLAATSAHRPPAPHP